MKHELKMLPPEENFRTVRILEQLARTNRALAELRICKNNTKSTYINKCYNNK